MEETTRGSHRESIPWLRSLKQDQELLDREAEAVQAAGVMRAWYDAWGRAWTACQARGVVSVDHSEVWYYLTGQARTQRIPADAGQMERWLQQTCGEQCDQAEVF